MPVDVDSLRRVTTYGPRGEEGIPGLDDDEWVKMRGSRNAIDDFKAQIKSQVPNTAPGQLRPGELNEGDAIPDGEEDPDVVAAEQHAANATTSEFDTDEGERWWHIFDYMLHSFNLYRAASAEDLAAGRMRGKKLDHRKVEDRRDVFLKLGAEFVVLLSNAGGSTATAQDNVKGPDGKQIPFQEVSTVGDQGPEAAV